MLTLLALLFPVLVQASVDEPAFPPASAIEVGLDPVRLAAVDELVAAFVADGDVVGAELLVIKNGRTVLHSAHGSRDRESNEPMELGSVFCVRSMTKPLIGAATRILIEEDLLELDDRVADHLPAFDAESTRDITVEHLLRHTSGLPMSLIMTRDPRSLTSTRAVADLGGGTALDFEPGTDFQYSDQGTDTLTALIEVVTGAPAEAFVRERVLAPLGMTDSVCVFDEADPLRARACVKYAGSPGSWQPFWKPADEPLFPVFLGSQGLYSTTTDYARFLQLYLKRGRGPDGRILKSRSVRQTFEPTPHSTLSGTGFPGVDVRYGSMMLLHVDPESGDLVAFGHNGSDGTYAWAFPKQRAMVLYFTQSRGTPTGLRLEERLAELLLGKPFDPIEAAPPLEPYLGYYFEGEGDLYRAIVRDGNGIGLEILGKAVVPLVYAGGDRWKMKPQPATVLEFQRDAEGHVTGFHIGDHVEHRLVPSADLPEADEVSARVAAAHGIARLADVDAGEALHVRRSISIPTVGVEAQSAGWLAWPQRWSVVESTGDVVERFAYDGEVVRRQSGDDDPRAIEGEQAAALRAESPFVRYGDWSAHFDALESIQRIEREGRPILVVRAGDLDGGAVTFYVDEEGWLLRGVDELTVVDGLGQLGRRTILDDHREVLGMQWPHRARMRLANPLLGEIELRVESIELGRPPEGCFTLTATGDGADR